MTHARNILLGAAAALATTGSVQSARAGTTATVVLEVSTFRRLNGFLGCQLYADRESFPDNASSQPSLHRRVPVTAPTASCTFTNLPAGTYAAAVIHDENGNGKLDKNFFGVPTEAYGISNNRTRPLTRPTWNESAFTVNADTTVTARISLLY